MKTLKIKAWAIVNKKGYLIKRGLTGELLDYPPVYDTRNQALDDFSDTSGEKIIRVLMTLKEIKRK